MAKGSRLGTINKDQNRKNTESEKKQKGGSRLGFGKLPRKRPAQFKAAETSGYDLSEFTPHTGDDLNVLFDDPYEERAEAQGFGEELGTSALNLVPNIGLGLLENAGYLYETAAHGFGFGDSEDLDFSNILTETAKDYRNPAGDIHQADPTSFFDPSDSASWVKSGFNLFESVGEFAATGAGLGGTLGRGAKGLARVLKTGARGEKALTGAAQTATSYELAGVEASMSGAQVFDKQYRNYRAQGLSDLGARQKAGKDAADTYWLSTGIVGALNMTSVAPLFKSTNRIRRAEKLGLNRMEGEGHGTYANRLKEVIDNPETKRGLYQKYGLGIEALSESTEENVNLFAEQMGMGETEGSFQGFLDSTLSGEGLHSGILGALGGMMQSGIMRNLPSYSEPQRDDQGNIVTDDDGNPKYKRKSAKQLEREQNLVERTQTAEIIKEDLNSIDNANKRIRDAVRNPGEDSESEIEKGKRDLFNVTAKRSVLSGNGENLKATYDEIKGYDNTQLDENGETEAMKKGVAESPEDNSYVQKAEEAKRDIDNLTDLYNRTVSQYDFSDPSVAKLGEAVFNLKAKKYHLNKQLEDLERTKTQVQNDLNRATDDRGDITHARDLASRARAINKSIEKLNKEKSTIDNYLGTKESKRTQGQEESVGRLKSKYGVGTTKELQRAIEDSVNDNESRKRELEKEYNDLKQYDENLDEKIKRAAKGDNDLDQINQAIENTRSEVSTINNSLERITSSKGQDEFIDNTVEEIKRQEEREDKFKKKREETEYNAIKEDLENATTPEDLSNRVAKNTQVNEQTTEEALHEIKKEQKKEAPLFSKADPINRYEGRPVLFTEEMAEIREASQQAVQNGTLSQEDAAVIDNSLDSLEGFENLIGSQITPEIESLLDSYYEAKNNTEEETGNPTEEDDTADPEDPEDGEGEHPPTDDGDSLEGLQGAEGFTSNFSTYQFKKDDSGNIARDELGRVQFARDENGELIPNKVGRAAGIDFEYRDNPDGLQEGDTIYYEVKADLLRNDYHQNLGDTNSENFRNNFLVQAVAYDSEGNRHVVGAFPVYNPKGKEPHNFSTIRKVRDKILEEYKNREDSRNIFTSSFSTKVKDKRAGYFKTVPGARQDPRDVLIKSDGSGSYDFHIGIARRDTTGSPYLDTADTAPEIDSKNVEPGKAYFAVPSSNGNRIPAKLRIRNLRDQHDFIKDKYGEKKESLLETASPLIKGIKKGNQDHVISQLNDLFMADAEFKNNKLHLYTGDFETRSENRKRGNPDITIDPNDSIESIESQIEGLSSKVDVNKINRDDYNSTIADEGRVYSDIRPGIFTHSSTITVADIAVETDQEAETSVEKQEGTREATEESQEAAREYTEKEEGEAPLPSQEERRTVRDPRSTKATDKRKVKTNRGTRRSKISWKNRSKGDDEVYDLFKNPNYKKWNKQEELKWLNDNLPNVPNQVLDGLIEVNKNGGTYAFGMFQNGIIQLSEQSEAGTAYHEAGHAVFRMFNTSKQQRGLLNEARKRYKEPTEEDLNDLSSHKPDLSREELTDLYYEEKIMEEFQEYKLMDGDLSVSQRIGNFFKKILDYIKSLFTSNVSIDQLFRRMDNSYYANKEPFKRDLSSLGGAAFNAAGGMTNREIKDRTSLINDQLFEAIEAVKEDKPFYKDLKDTEIINSLSSDSRSGLDELYLDVYDSINENVRNDLTEIAKEEGASQAEIDEIHDKIDRTLQNFLILDENGEVAKRGDLYYSAVRDLKGHGIHLSFKEGMNAEETALDIEEQIENEVEERIDRREQWQVSRKATSQKETLSQRVKRLLKTIKDPNDFDDLGIQRNIEFDELFNYLKRELSGVPTTNDILDRLEDIKEYKPGVEELINILNKDPQLASQFKSQFNNTHTKHLNIFETQNNEFKLAFANQNSIHNILMENWKTSMNRTDIRNRDGSINTEKAAELSQRFEKEYNKLKRAKEIKVEDLKEISSVLNETGIKMDPQNLHDAYRKGRVRGTDIGSKGSKPLQNMLSLIASKQGSIRSLFNLLKNGQDPFEGSGFPALNNLARIKAFRENDLFESSFLGPNNKRIHAHLEPTNLSMLVDTIKNDPDRRDALIREYRKDPFYYKSPWLKDLEDNKTSAEFDYAMLSEFKPRDRGRGTEYNALTSSELLSTQINAWYNNGWKKSYYMVPIQSDRPNAYFVRHKKYDTIDAVVEDLYQVALQEKARINGNFKPRDKDGNEYDIESFEKNKKKHILLPFMNEYKEDITENPLAVKEHIRTKIEEEFESFYANEVENKIDNYLDSNIRNKEGKVNKEDVKLFYFSKYVADTQTGTLLAGDPAFYKSKDDFYKRVGMTTAPGTFMDIGARYGDTKVPSTRRVVYLEDSELDGEQSISNEVREGLINNGFDENTATSISNYYGVSDSVNETDAQTFITLDEFKRIQVGLGRWNENLEKAYKDAKQGKAVDSDISLIFQTIKPVNVGFKKVGKKMVPFQHKNSEAVLLPQLATLGKKENDPPTRMEKMLNWMEEKGVDALHFESAVKVGKFGVASFEDIDSNNDPYIHSIPNRTLRLQQETPVHEEGEDITFPTQLRRIMTSDLSPDFSIPSSNETGGMGVKNSFQDLISANIRESFNKLKSQFSDIKELRNTLLSEVEDQQYGDELRKALEIEYDNQGNERFKIELYHPIHSQRTEQLLNSIFKNRVNKQRINGEQLIQQSAIGFREDLQIHFKRDSSGKVSSIDYVDVMLPWKYKSMIKPEDENGYVDESLISENARKLITNAMPYEDKYSSLPLRIKGFLPEGAGQSILLPSEVTTIMGNDFDIDKLFVMMPNLTKRIDYKNAEKVLREEGFNYDSSKIKEIVKASDEELDSREKDAKDTLNEILRDNKESKKNSLYTIDSIKYNDKTTSENNSKEQRDNRIIEMMYDVLTYPESFDKVLNPGNFESLKELESDIREKKTAGEEDTGIFSPSTQLDMFNRVTTGARLVGLVANHNTNHSAAQYSDLKTITPVAFDSKIDLNRIEELSNKDELSEQEEGELGISLNKTHTFDGDERISKNLASVLAAAVDNLKEPVAGGLNLNTFTTDTAALIMRAGYSQRTAISLINQPIIEEFTRRVFETNTRPENVKTIFRELVGELVDEEGASLSDLKVNDSGEIESTVFDLNTNELWDNIGKDPSEDPNFSLKALSSFTSYWETANELSDIISGTRADTQNGAIGPSIAHNESKIESARRVKGDSFNNWRNTNTLFDNYPMLNDFFEYGIDRPNEILKMGLNEDGSIRSLDQEYGGYYIWGLPGMQRVRKEIEAEMGKQGIRGMSPNDISKVQDQFLSYLVAQNQFFNIKPDEKNRILKETPDKIAKLKDEGARIANNPFLSRLHVRDSQDNYYTNSNIRRLILNNAGSMSAEEAELISKGWEYLINTEQYSDLGKDLVRYAFLTNGLEFTSNSFAHFIPVSFLDTLNKREGLSEHMRSKENELRLFEAESGKSHIYTPFIQRFLKNNYDDSRLVPKFADTDSAVEIIEKDKVNKKQVPVRIRAPYRNKYIFDRKNGNLFRNVGEGEFIISDKYGMPGVMKEWTEGSSYISNNNVQIENIPERDLEYNEDLTREEEQETQDSEVEEDVNLEGEPSEIEGSTESRRSINTMLVRQGAPQIEDNIFDQVEKKAGQNIESLINKYGIERTAGRIIKNYC